METPQLDNILLNIVRCVAAPTAMASAALLRMEGGQGKEGDRRSQLHSRGEGGGRGSLIIELGEHGDPSLYPMALGLI
jgi:hypothetical protein